MSDTFNVGRDTVPGTVELNFDEGDSLFFKNVRNDFKKLADIKGSNEGDISEITSLDELLGLLQGFDEKANDRFTRNFDEQGQLVLSIGDDANDSVTISNIQASASGNRIEVGGNGQGTVNVLNGDVLFLGGARNAAGDLDVNEFQDAPTLATADEFYELIDEVLEGTAPIFGQIFIDGVQVTKDTIGDYLGSSSDITINFTPNNAGPREIVIEGGFDALAIRDYLDDGQVAFNGTTFDFFS